MTSIPDGSLFGEVMKFNSYENEAAPFQTYLSLFEVANQLRSDLALATLSTPMIYPPVNRTANGFQSQISLSGYNEFDHKRSVDAATSRSQGSTVTMAIGRLALKYRLLLEKDNGKAKAEFYEEEQIKSLTKALKSLGYDWELECIDPLSNQYDVRLKKQKSSFLSGSASSGEKELLTYLFSIYALNVRDALIIVDEPELHLHPKWQNTLLVCPECSKGKLYKQTQENGKIRTLIRITGHAPLQATIHKFFDLRCNDCKTVFKVETPEDLAKEGSESQRFSNSAIAMIGVQKYLLVRRGFVNLNCKNISA